jgi:branched-chain amino acid transport system substrate-binding protein
MKKLSLMLTLIVLLTSLLFMSCSATTPTPSPAPASSAKPVPATTPAATSASTTGAPIKIGALLQVTGSGATEGPVEKRALEFRLEQIGYQVAGRQIQLVIEDDASDTTVGLDKARKLVQFDKVDVLLGPVDGGIAFGVGNFMKTVGIPMLPHQPKDFGVSKLGNNIFLPSGTGQGVSYPIGLYANSKLGYKTAVIIYNDMTAAGQFTDGMTAGFTKNGGTIVQKIPVKTGTLDFAPYLSSMQTADIVLFWFILEDSQRFLQQYFATGLKMPLASGISSILPSRNLQTIGDKTIGILAPTGYTNLIDTPVNKSYVDAFLKKYSILPEETGIGLDIALSLYLEAVKATAGDATPAKIIDALYKVKADTPSGTRSLSPDRIGIGDLYIAKVVKVSDRYDWSVVDKTSQIVIDMPK